MAMRRPLICIGVAQCTTPGAAFAAPGICGAAIRSIPDSTGGHAGRGL